VLLLQLWLEDFLLLQQPTEWLNDELVNYYVLLLQVGAAARASDDSAGGGLCGAAYNSSQTRHQ
jgi:hypothetical protein